MQNFMTAAEARYGRQGNAAGSIQITNRDVRLQNEEYMLKQQKKKFYSELTRLTKVVIDENTKISFTEY